MEGAPARRGRQSKRRRADGFRRSTAQWPCGGHVQKGGSNRRLGNPVPAPRGTLCRWLGNPVPVPVPQRQARRIRSPSVRPRPNRLERLPRQFFVTLLARVAAAAAEEGPPLVDLGRGNPDIGPPPHVVEQLRESAGNPIVHGYGPIRGLRRTKEALAARYRDVYGVELDPEREIAIVPGTKTSIVELAMALAQR